MTHPTLRFNSASAARSSTAIVLGERVEVCSLVRSICVCTCVAPHQVSCAAEKTVTLARARCGAMRGGLILQLLRSEQLQRTRSSRRL